MYFIVSWIRIFHYLVSSWFDVILLYRNFIRSNVLGIYSIVYNQDNSNEVKSIVIQRAFFFFFAKEREFNRDEKYA